MNGDEQSRLQTLWDHHAIRELLATYCHGCDRGDEVMMAGTYCQDSWDDHGTRKMDGKRFAWETVDESLETTTLVSHQLGQSLIRVDGDSAGAETYFIATLRYPGDDRQHQLGGRYVDWLAREDGAWKIRKRVCVREWSVSQPIAGDWLARAGFVDSRRGPEDCSWDALGLPFSGQLLAAKAVAD